MRIGTGSIGRHRRARVLAALLVATALTAFPATSVRAGSPAILDCTRAMVGRWEVDLPAPGVAELDYWSRIVFELETPYLSSSGVQQSLALFSGDSVTAWWWTEDDGLQQFEPGYTHIFGGTASTGVVKVWEHQFYPGSDEPVVNALGACVIWQYFEFFPFPG